MRLYQVIFLLLIMLFFSCEEGSIIRCEDCSTKEPLEAQLKVRISEDFRNVEIKVYEGDLEDSILYDSAISVISEFTFSVQLNKKYTVTAAYHNEGSLYTAVDSALPRVKFDEEQCDEPCYYIYDNNINLRLKN